MKPNKESIKSVVTDPGVPFWFGSESKEHVKYVLLRYVEYICNNGWVSPVKRHENDCKYIGSVERRTYKILSDTFITRDKVVFYNRFPSCQLGFLITESKKVFVETEWSCDGIQEGVTKIEEDGFEPLSVAKSEFSSFLYCLPMFRRPKIFTYSASKHKKIYTHSGHLGQAVGEMNKEKESNVQDEEIWEGLSEDDHDMLRFLCKSPLPTSNNMGEYESPFDDALELNTSSSDENLEIKDQFNLNVDDSDSPGEEECEDEGHIESEEEDESDEEESEEEESDDDDDDDDNDSGCEEEEEIIEREIEKKNEEEEIEKKIVEKFVKTIEEEIGRIVEKENEHNEKKPIEEVPILPDTAPSISNIYPFLKNEEGKIQDTEKQMDMQSFKIVMSNLILLFCHSVFFFISCIFQELLSDEMQKKLNILSYDVVKNVKKEKKS